VHYTALHVQCADIHLAKLVRCKHVYLFSTFVVIYMSPTGRFRKNSDCKIDLLLLTALGQAFVKINPVRKRIPDAYNKNLPQKASNFKIILQNLTFTPLTCKCLCRGGYFHYFSDRHRNPDGDPTTQAADQC